jgi:hypothetical protein
MKFSRAISQVKLLNGEKNQRFGDHLCPRPQGSDMDIAGKAIDLTSWKDITKMNLKSIGCGCGFDAGLYRIEISLSDNREEVSLTN